MCRWKILSDSRSRIMDTDYAKETSELTRTQSLQQAGTAMLAQAEALPQSVRQVLQQGKRGCFSAQPQKAPRIPSVRGAFVCLQSRRENSCLFEPGIS